MKSSAKKKRIWAMLISVLFVLTTAIGLLGMPVKSYAAGENTPTTLKFCQVAAGEDFAIALTYGGDLYGWSLLPAEGKNTELEGTANAKSLGEYYPVIPIRIDVKFTCATYSGTEAVYVGLDSTDELLKNSDYVGARDNDKVIGQIAATRETAAFLTKSGLIYTWGINDAIEPAYSTNESYHEEIDLLFHGYNASTDSYKPAANTFIPAMVNYTLYSELLPVGSETFASSVTELVASEYNYMLHYNVGNTSKSFIWGQAVYNQMNAENADEHYTSMFGFSHHGTVFEHTTGNNNFTSEWAYLGDGNTYYFASIGMYANGKNYAVKASDLSSGNITTSVKNTLTNDNDKSFDGKVYQKITDSETSDVTDKSITIPSAITKSFVGIGNALTPMGSSRATYYNSDGTEANLTVNRSVFSAGEGFGYVLDGNGGLHFWGDNSENQGAGSSGLSATANQVTTLSALGGTYVQVVAGKKLTGEPILQEALQATTVVASNNTVVWESEDKLDSKHVDSSAYLSATLTANGTINIFGYLGYNVNVPTETTAAALAKCGVATGNNSNAPANRIVYLGGGYGNNLFAISSLGKMYRITATGESSIAVETYDVFQNSDNTVIDNWSVNDNAAVTFKTGYYEDGDTSIAVSTKKLTNENDSTFAQIDANPEVISSTYSGDAYRIIVPKTGSSAFTVNKYVLDDGGNWVVPQDGSNYTGISDITKSTFKLAPKYGDAASNGEISNALQFYWSNDTLFEYPISAEMAFRYFDIEYRYKESGTVGEDSVMGDVDFVITPKRSTGKQSIIIKYLVGRYDTVTNFDSSVTTKSEFYDVRQVSVKVTIQNTLLTPEYQTGILLEGKSGPDTSDIYGSAVPLLDPNNPVNNVYSLAVMNVTEGLKEFLTEFNKALVGAKQDSSSISFTSDDVLNLVKNNDKGFPASSKINEGNLTYFNKYASSYYTDKYTYLANDIDGDIISLTKIENSTGLLTTNTSGDIKSTASSSTRFASYAKDTVMLRFDLTDSDGNPQITAEAIQKLKNLFEGTTANVQVPQFNNLYGLTITVDPDGYQVTVSYDIIRITAITSMPSEYIGYTGGDVSTPEYKLATTSSMSHTPLIRPILQDESSQTVTLDNTDVALHRGIEVFVQSSLSFTATTTDSDSVSHTNYYLGAPNPPAHMSNTYNYNAISLQLPTNTSTVNLAALFNDSTNIYLAYNGEVGAEDIWNEIQTTFGSSSNAVQMKINNALSFTLTARRAIADFEFSVELRRVLPGTATDTFVYGADESETLKIYFKFTFKIDDSQWTLSATPQLPTTINEYSEFNLLDNRLGIAANVLRLCTAEVWSSNRDIVEVSMSADNSRIIFNPKTSGDVYIRYKIKLFGEEEYVLEESFKVTVVVLFSMGKTVYVMDTVEVSVSEMSSILTNTLGTDYKFTLTNVEGTNEPYYFQEGALKPDADLAEDDDNDYTWTTRSEVPFLNGAYVDPSASKNYIALVMGSYDPSSTDSVPIYRMVVHFTEESGESYFVAIRIAPSAQRLRDEYGREVVVTINKKDNTISITSSGSGEDGINAAKTMGLITAEDGSFEIPVNPFLKSLIGGNAANTYVIIAAQAKSYDSLDDYSKYMDVKTVTENATEFFITPLYPTAEITGGRANVRVSVKTNNTGDTANNVTMLNFYVEVTGIDTVLPVSTYKTIVLAAFFSVLGVLIIIFFIRMGIYWKKKADQRRIIKKNQTLIKMREKMHNKTEAVSKEKLVRTKLKMEDPKYAKMFDEMRRNKEAETGIALENSLIANKVDKKMKIEKEKKKRGKKSLEELQEELAAKREAVARMQMGDFSQAPEGVEAVDATTIQSVPPVEPVDGVPMDGVPVFDPNAGFEGMSAEDLDAQFKAAMAGDGMGESIVFEADENKPNENQ